MDNHCTRLLLYNDKKKLEECWLASHISHIGLKASKVDETRVRKISRVAVIDAEEEVQGECGNHGGKELQTEQKKKI